MVSDLEKKKGEERLAYPKLEVLAAHILHGRLCPLGVLAEEHLDKGMALVLVDDAGLDLAETVEDFAELVFRAAGRGQSAMSCHRSSMC